MRGYVEPLAADPFGRPLAPSARSSGSARRIVSGVSTCASGHTPERLPEGG